MTHNTQIHAVKELTLDELDLVSGGSRNGGDSEPQPRDNVIEEIVVTAPRLTTGPSYSGWLLSTGAVNIATTNERSQGGSTTATAGGVVGSVSGTASTGTSQSNGAGFSQYDCNRNRVADDTPDSCWAAYNSFLRSNNLVNPDNRG